MISEDQRTRGAAISSAGRPQTLRFSLSDQGDLFGHEAYPGLLARLTLTETSLWRRLRASLAGRPRLRDLNPPHTPAWTGLNLDYAVSARCGPEVLEHRHPWVEYIDPPPDNGAVTILPHYDRPVLALGLAGVKPAEIKRPVSLYFHLQNLASGRYDPGPDWIGADLSRDETQGLTRSGLVTMTLNETAAQAGVEDPIRVNLRWPGAAPDLALQGLHEHAAWAVFDLEAWLKDGEPERPWPLPAGSLTAWAPLAEGQPPPGPTPLQPYPSIGGRPRGSGRSADFWQDQAEELSHRGQAVLPRDYERLVLREFPEVLAVKCLPHTNDKLDRNQRGQTALIIFAPQAGARLYRADGGFSLKPELPARADDQLTALVHKFLAGRASPLVTIHALQPCFQAVTPVLRGILDPWKNSAEARAEAVELLGRFLAPWAFEPDRAVFSRPLDQSELEDQLRSLPWLLKLLELELQSDGPLQPERPDILFHMDAPRIELEIA